MKKQSVYKRGQRIDKIIGYAMGPSPDGCGKVRYSTRARANVARKQIHKKPGDPKLQVYRCDPCDAWHVGHKPYWKRQAAAREARAREAS